MHANLYPAMIEHSNVIAGYHTYPHIDMDATARRAAVPLFRMLAGEAEPTMVWGNAPMLPHVMRQGTDDFPNDVLQARARAAAADLPDGPFRGVPLLLKDLLLQTQGDPYHAGTRFLKQLGSYNFV